MIPKRASMVVQPMSKFLSFANTWINNFIKQHHHSPEPICHPPCVSSLERSTLILRSIKKYISHLVLLFSTNIYQQLATIVLQLMVAMDTWCFATLRLWWKDDKKRLLQVFIVDTNKHGWVGRQMVDHAALNFIVLGPEASLGSLFNPRQRNQNHSPFTRPHHVYDPKIKGVILRPNIIVLGAVGGNLVVSLGVLHQSPPSSYRIWSTRI